MFALALYPHGWSTRAQTDFGAPISVIQAQMHGQPNRRAQQGQLGYLWSMPPSGVAAPNTTGTGRDHDAELYGLGGGITWAWDPELCAPLLARFREDIAGVQFITCDDAQAAVARAFSKWSDNNRHLRFIDVTSECRKLGWCAALLLREIRTPTWE